jgi:hypothetical protein
MNEKRMAAVTDLLTTGLTKADPRLVELLVRIRSNQGNSVENEKLVKELCGNAEVPSLCPLVMYDLRHRASWGEMVVLQRTTAAIIVALPNFMPAAFALLRLWYSTLVFQPIWSAHFHALILGLVQGATLHYNLSERQEDLDEEVLKLIEVLIRHPLSTIDSLFAGTQSSLLADFVKNGSVERDQRIASFAKRVVRERKESRSRVATVKAEEVPFGSEGTREFLGNLWSKFIHDLGEEDKGEIVASYCTETD